MKALNLLLFILLCISVHAQYDLTGTIVDQDNEYLTGSTVVLLDNDSTMVSFALSDENGRYEIADIDTGRYILQVSFISYANYCNAVQVTGDMHLDPIVMKESTEVLKEVTINAEHIPMGLRGDTLSYNAAAFKTRPNANVEDLLKQMPGIEVDRAGNIKAQGKDVKNVLVGGKEFFGKNPEMATRNLEAESVDKVEVYDKKSEVAEFTGVDDGQDERTINLELKDEYKTGGFGRVEAHGGLDGEYEGKANYYKYSPTYQASALVAANNINKSTFTINDRIDFMGGFMNAIEGANLFSGSPMNGVGQGINESLSAGINFNADINPKLTLRSHYLHSRDQNVLDKWSSIEGWANGFDYTNSRNTASTDTKRDHQLNTKLQYKANPFFQISLRNNLNYNSVDQNSLTRDEYLSNVSTGTTNSAVMEEGNSLMFNSSLLLKNKFRKKGRNIITKIDYQNGRQLSEDYVINSTRLTQTMLDINQRQEFENPNAKFDFSSNYTEPLGKKFFLGIDYNYSKHSEDPIKEFYDRTNEVWLTNEDLGVKYNKDFSYNSAGLSIKRNTKNLEWQIGLKGQFTRLYGELPEQAESINSTYQHLLPASYLLYQPGGAHIFNMNYSTQVIAPTLQQLMPQVDNQNANYEYVGNPDLNPAYRNALTLSYNYYDQFSFTNFWARSTTMLSKHRIMNSVEVNDELFRRVTPVNIDRFLSQRFSTGFSQPFRPLSIVYSIRANANVSTFDNLINGDIDNILKNEYGLDFSVRNKNQNTASIEAGVHVSRSINKYDLNTSFNQTYDRLDFFVDALWEMGKKWVLASDIRYNTFSQDRFEGDPQFTLWNASLSKLLWEDRIEVKITAHDILNENIGIQRIAGTSTIREERFNNLTRFVTLGLSYKLGKGKSNNVKFISE